MSRRTFWAGASLLVLALTILLWAAWPRPFAGQGERFTSAGFFSSNGQRIYYTGISAGSGAIPFRGGPMWARMHGAGCASCHGEDGRGGKTVMMSAEKPADIRYNSLISGKHSNDEQEGKEEHPPYTDELIKRAITQGINSAGKELDAAMPRWEMSEADLNDLIAYLKTLQ